MELSSTAIKTLLFHFLLSVFPFGYGLAFLSGVVSPKEAPDYEPALLCEALPHPQTKLD